jgi:hypothetical protein
MAVEWMVAVAQKRSGLDCEVLKQPKYAVLNELLTHYTSITVLKKNNLM